MSEFEFSEFELSEIELSEFEFSCTHYIHITLNGLNCYVYEVLDNGCSKRDYARF